jgi:phosphate-selective porin OprO and OprP
MSFKHSLVAGVGVGALLLVAAAPGHAQTVRQLERQIDQLQDNYQSQIQNLQQQLDQLKQQQVQQNEMAQQAAARSSHGPHVVETHGHEFGLESADGQNSIYLTGRIHFDTGGYVGYSPGPHAPLALSGGANFRRARIGLVGKFMGDWDYGLIADFGGSSDSFSSSIPGSSASAIENAFVVYNGFKHSSVPTSWTIGAIDVPWTMDEATSSNDIMFIERSSSQVIATAFGGGDNRTAFGVTSNNDRYWVGAFLTGPTTGSFHEFGGSSSGCTIGASAGVPPTGLSTSTDNCTGPQMAFLARGTYQVLQNSQGSLHLGVNFGDEFRPRNGSNESEIGLSERPELRLDPTTFLGTGNIAASDGWVIGAEAAAAYENAFLQGEYFHYNIDQLTPGYPGLGMDGGYVEASYSFGGRRHYKAGAGAYTGVIPEAPLSWSNGTWGAFEIAARYSVADLNSGNTAFACPASAAIAVERVCGGNQETFAVGLNWYPNDNLRFMLDYEHAHIGVPAGTATAKGANIDFIALRTQVNW